MLTNDYRIHHLREYEEIFLRNFGDETKASFDYLTRNYLLKSQVYLWIDGTDRVGLGLAVIPKTIERKGRTLRAGLLYGVAASERYKKTGVLKKALPGLVDALEGDNDLLLVESEHWKIYDGFNLRPVNDAVFFRSAGPSVPPGEFASRLFRRSERVVAEAFRIHLSHSENFPRPARVKYSFAEFDRLLGLNTASGERILLSSGAFGIHDPKANRLFSVYFGTQRALNALCALLPEGCAFALDAKLAGLVDAPNAVRGERFVKTKMFPNGRFADNLFFNDPN